MKSQFVAAREFVRGVAARKDRVFVISKGKALMGQSIAHTSVVAVEGSKWADCVDTDWDSTAIAGATKPARKLVIVGEDGDVVVYLGGGNSDSETLKPTPSAIRNARGIAGYVYACGMKRQVYKRTDEKKWKAMNAPAPKKADEAVGFEAIDGYSESEVYAVGWQGEIWEHDGKAWHDHSTPTNLVLTCVCCAPDDTVYVGGQQGTLMHGRHGIWEPIDLEEDFGADVWDLCWYNDKLYIATIQALFTLKGKRLIEVDFGAAGPATCFSLTTAEGVLWSVGHQDVLSFDGKRWQRYD